MAIFKNSIMDYVCYDGTIAEGLSCEVIINGDEIAVSFKHEQEFIIYKGKEKGQGHYQLDCPEQNGKANLHRFAEGKFLDGYWEENKIRGFWRIYLEK